MKILKGPKLPKFIQGILYYHNPYQFLIRCRKKYGKIFKINLPGFTPMVVMSEPDMVKQIFSGNPEVLCAGKANAVYFMDIFGKNSILTLDGPSHLCERKLISPSFHGNPLKNYGEKIFKITDDVLDKWPEKTLFRIAPQLQAITLRVIISVVFGVENCSQFNAIYTILSKILIIGENPFNSFLVGLFPKLCQLERVKKVYAQMHELLDQQIRHRRQNPNNENDVLSILLQAKDENGQGLKDQALREEVLTVLLTGYETTAVTAAWVIYYVLTHREVYKKIKSELKEVTTDNNSLSIEQIQKLSYLSDVIKETIRYQPVIPFVARELQANFKIDQYEIEKGTTLVPCIYLAGNDPDLWQSPHQFLPERFLQEENNPYHYFPFGGGVRRCIGSSFALFELQILLAKIFHRFDLSLKSKYKARPIRNGVSFGPSHGVPIIIS